MDPYVKTRIKQGINILADTPDILREFISTVKS